MLKWFFATGLLIMSSPSHADFFGLFGYDNFHECILDNMPGVSRHKTARVIYRDCKKDHSPTAHVEKQRPFFGVKTAKECAGEYGVDYSQAGIGWIRTACNALYY